MFFFWSTLKPRPNPTRMITDAIPHTIPKHGQEGAHFVGPECGERLAQDFGESHDSP